MGFLVSLRPLSLDTYFYLSVNCLIIYILLCADQEDFPNWLHMLKCYTQIVVKHSSALSDPYFQKLNQLVMQKYTDTELLDTVVNAPFHDPLRAVQLDLGVVVLLVINRERKTIDRVALSNTMSAHGAVRMSAKPFKDIRIPLGHTTNIIAKAITTGQPQQTDDWQYLFIPELSASEAHFNQAGAGIECSYVYPLSGKQKGALIFSLYQPLAKINDKHRDFFEFYTNLVSAAL